jgi:hypothetical protein
MRVTINRTILLIVALAGAGCAPLPEEDDGAQSHAGTGGASASSTGDGLGGAIHAIDTSQPKDIKPCDSRPEVGAPCKTYDQKCQIAEKSCGSIFTCYDVWTEVKNCTSPASECPSYTPQSGVPCAKVGLACRYVEACGVIDAECKDGVWSATPQPLPECESLCKDLCTRLTACGVSWASSCLSACRAAHTCPSSSSKQETVALCQTRATAIATLECKALCENATRANPGLGEDDCGD